MVTHDMSSRVSDRQKVAIIGSGMAGLVTAYLLQTDPSSRFEVEVFETVGVYYSLPPAGF